MPTPDEILRPLRRTRQVREFESAPLDPAALDALVDVARWSGSSQNKQPWRFLVISDPATLRALHDSGLPSTRGLASAVAAIAIVMPSDPARAVSNAYDEGRAAERILVAASMLGLGAGISWIQGEAREKVSRLLGLPEDRSLRTIVQLGHPTAAAQEPKSAPGEARLPADQVVFRDRWPSD
jgi:nitroreductase